MKILFQTAKPILIDLMSTLFFALLYSLTHDVVLAIAAAVGLGIGQILLALALRRRIWPMQWMSLVLVLVLGGATLLTNDPRFVMVKPTVIYAVIGAVMLQRGWQLRYVPAQAATRVELGVLIAWGYVWAGLMFVIAIANLAIALSMPLAVWAWCAAVLFPGLKIGLFALEYAVIRGQARRRLSAQPAAA